MSSKKGDQLNYFFGVGYYVLGMLGDNNKPMIYQRHTIQITREEYIRIKKEIDNKEERFVVHPIDGEENGLVETFHHHQPLAVCSVFYQGKPKAGIIIPKDAGKISSGRLN